MDDISQDLTPEPASSGPPPPQLLPSFDSSPRTGSNDGSFGLSRRFTNRPIKDNHDAYGYDDDDDEDNVGRQEGNGIRNDRNKNKNSKNNNASAAVPSVSSLLSGDIPMDPPAKKQGTSRDWMTPRHRLHDGKQPARTDIEGQNDGTGRPVETLVLPSRYNTSDGMNDNGQDDGKGQEDAEVNVHLLFNANHSNVNDSNVNDRDGDDCDGDDDDDNDEDDDGEGTFLSDRSLEKRIRRSLAVDPSKIMTMTPAKSIDPGTRPGKGRARRTSVLRQPPGTIQQEAPSSPQRDRTLEDLQTRLEEALAALKVSEQRAVWAEQENEDLRQEAARSDRQSNTMNHQLSNMKDLLEQSQDRHARLVDEIKQLQCRNAALQGECDAVRDENGGLQESVRTAKEEVMRLEHRVELKDTEIVFKTKEAAGSEGRAKEYHGALTKLQDDIVQAKSEARMKADECHALRQQVNDHMQTKKQLSDASEEVEALRNRMAELASTVDDTKRKLVEAKEEIDRLTKQGQCAVDVRESATQTDGILPWNEHGLQTSPRSTRATGRWSRGPFETSTLSSPSSSSSPPPGETATATATATATVGGTRVNTLTDRLDRIRESTDRSALHHEHQRELARLASVHDRKMAEAEASYENKLRKAQEEARTDRNTRTRELKRSLVKQYEEQIATMETEHNQEVARVRQNRLEVTVVENRQ